MENMPMYVDVPETYRWDKKEKEWTKRKREIFQTIGRVHSVPHTAGDVFYLRMLLNHEHSRGKESHNDMLKLQSGESCETFKQVCEKLGLLQDDNEWVECLTESMSVQGSPELRRLYVSIVLWSAPSNPRALFDQFWEAMTDDFEKTAEEKKVVLEKSQPPELPRQDGLKY